MSALGSQVKWVPHGRMPADAMTKIDAARGKLALSGTMCLMDEEGHLSERQLNLSLKSRSRKKCLEEMLKREETKSTEERGGVIQERQRDEGASEQGSE